MDIKNHTSFQANSKFILAFGLDPKISSSKATAVSTFNVSLFLSLSLTLRRTLNRLALKAKAVLTVSVSSAQ